MTEEQKSLRDLKLAAFLHGTVFDGGVLLQVFVDGGRRTEWVVLKVPVGNGEGNS